MQKREKCWIESEEGKQAALEVSQIPEAVQVITEQGRAYIRVLTDRVLSANVSDASRDRALVVAHAELNGAENMLKSLLTLLNDAGKPNKRDS